MFWLVESVAAISDNVKNNEKVKTKLQKFIKKFK